MQSFEFCGGKVESPVPIESCGVCPRDEDLPVQIRFMLRSLVSQFDHVVAGDFVISGSSFVALPVIQGLTVVNFLALVVDEDSSPITLYIGTAPATEGSFVVTSNMVLTPNGISGAQFFVKGGLAEVRLVAAGT